MQIKYYDNKEESTKTLKCNINHEEDLFFWEAAEQYD